MASLRTQSKRAMRERYRHHMYYRGRKIRKGWWVWGMLYKDDELLWEGWIRA